jgi:hypothetical protein
MPCGRAIASGLGDCLQVLAKVDLESPDSPIAGPGGNQFGSELSPAECRASRQRPALKALIPETMFVTRAAKRQPRPGRVYEKPVR